MTRKIKEKNVYNITKNEPSMFQESILYRTAFTDFFKNISIEENLWNIIKKTKNKIYNRKLPFPEIFINKIIEIEKNIYIFGI